jgi:hypothetical protein
MGSLIPIGQGADIEIKTKLNDVFGGNKLKKLQNHWKNKEKLFDKQHRLARFCARAKIFPTKSYPTNAKGKWFYLLEDILPVATDGSMDGQGNLITTRDAIKSALTAALDFDSNGITRVVFDAQEDSSVSMHRIYPSNGSPGQLIGTTLNIILICPAPLQDGNVDTPPTNQDPGENQLPFSETKRKKTRKKVSTRYRSGRKSSKARKKK